MTGSSTASVSIQHRIGELLDEALALADQLHGSAVAALIAQALHVLDDKRPIALPPGYAAAP